MDNEVTITTKQIKQAIDDLVDERDELQDKVNQLEKEVERLKEREKLVTEHYDVMVRHAGNLEGKTVVLETNINTAIDFIDQVLQYHLSPFDYKQVDEDINTLMGIKL